MKKHPLVTVNILSYNRKDELRNTLTKVFEQDYKNIEVIVVDNASTDGSGEMVKKEFPSVQLIQMEKNIGIAGWNEGFKISKGEYVLVLDDDAYPERDAIHLSLNEFNSNDSIACITFNLINVETNEYYKNNWLPQNKTEKTEWPVFVGCAFMIMKNRLPDSFTFPYHYFIYQHELPMSAEIYIHKRKIMFFPEIKGFHRFKIKHGYSVFNDKMNFKNTLLFITEYIPYSLVIFYYVQNILFYFTRSLRHRWFFSYLRIVFSTFPLKFRQKVPLSYFVLLRSKKIFNYSLLSKLSLH